jgi:glutathione S-transferase
MAVFNAEIVVELQEVALKDKPQAMLEASAKGTVPVLCLDDRVIDESLDIMQWALAINDPDTWLGSYTDTQTTEAFALVKQNDGDFKHWLDKYKYSSRFPEHDERYYRNQCGGFLSTLETKLTGQPYLFGEKITFADIAIFPFIRQFSMVDQKWFEQCEYPALRKWLNALLDLTLFKQIMAKELADKTRVAAKSL